MTSAGYERDALACLAACAKWQAEHPDARLKFRPRSWLPKEAQAEKDRQSAAGLRVSVIADLRLAIRGGVAGNSITRRLLETIDRATSTSGGATVTMAEYAIEQVFGIRNALTHDLQ